MAVTPSAMRELGSSAPDFSLADTTGTWINRTDFSGKPLLVAFISNHCPYVKHIGHKLGELASACERRGIGVVMIMSNDPSSHPEDAPDQMAVFAREYGITVPYLHDETQTIARAYQATCTPDFFLFDSDHTLVYRGQFDGARPGSDAPVTGADLNAAVDAVLAGKAPLADQHPSVGCNIKWKPGSGPKLTLIK